MAEVGGGGWRGWLGRAGWRGRCQPALWPLPTGSWSGLGAGAVVAALTDALALHPGVDLPPGPVLLVDARYRSGWTMTVAAALLRDAGATVVLPLVLHQLP